ncbi:hypothetical protein WOLCODRAFT_93593 [Wolfiporia cocos MD-104 SS10]|uniref:F-box domain-containing protein n=1 Tax=Wolfiporia cocos (strain MD-104) TaxID=742152 RepID=A0A2H3IU61_WOLCO|nr:hypothetical protein WOLCODRAFT_93593 [Wolfiporia cocos MD-104 SS10]
MSPDRPRIVDDLIPIILESYDHWWPRDYKRFALISPAWLAHIRKRLYTRPSLRTFHACNLFARSLSENPQLAPLLRAIDLRPFVARYESGGLNAQTMASLRFILSLDGLESVTLGGDLAVEAERFLHALSNAHAVTELRIEGSNLCWDSHCCSEPKASSLEWDEVMACKFARLRSLRLSNLELTVIPSPYMCPQLVDLSLDNVDIVDGSLTDLCNTSLETLHSLSVTTRNPNATDEGVHSLVEQCPNLETLRYEITYAPGHSTFFDDGIPECPSMRELHLSGLDVNPHTLVIIGQFCKNVELLSILGHDVQLLPDDWIMFLTSKTLPSLRELTTPGGSKYMPMFAYWTKTMYSQVEKACTDRNVKHISSVCYQ